MHQQTVTWLEHDVVDWIPGKSFAEINTQDFHVAIRQRAEKLNRVERSVLCDAACLIHHVSQVRLARSAILPGFSNFTANPNFRRWLEIVAAEYANGIKRLELGGRSRIRQSRGQIETFHARMKVRWI